MGRKGVVLVTLAFGLVAFETPASAQSGAYHVETTALLVNSSHRDFAAARSAALKLQEKLIARFVDFVNRPSPSVGASEAWRSSGGELYFLDANGKNVGYSPRWEKSEQVHVSIEDSSQLPGLVPGFFVVVIASGEPRAIWRLARRANAAGIRAHVRYARQVYTVGCRH